MLISQSLNKFKLNLLPESYLFKQETESDSVFFILDGNVVLTHGEDSKETVVNYVGPGEVLGEHLFFGLPKTKRAYSAKANTEVQSIRLTHAEIQEIKKTNPETYIDLLEHCGKIIYQRLMRANSLIHCFKYEKKEDRLLHLIVYFFDTFGRKTEQGIEVYLPETLFKFYIQLAQDEFRFCLKKLESLSLIKPIKKDTYLLTNRLALMQKLPSIVGELPTFSII